MRGQAIYLARIGDGETHKLGVTRGIFTRIPRLAQGLQRPVTLVACWPGDNREERRIHEALADAAVEPRLGRRRPCEVYFSAHPLFVSFLAAVPEGLRRDGSVKKSVSGSCGPGNKGRTRTWDSEIS